MGNWSTLQLLMVAFVSLILGVISGVLLARYYFFEKQFKEAEEKIKSLQKEQTKDILSAMGKKPKPEDLNRYLSRMERQKSASQSSSKKEKKKKK